MLRSKPHILVVSDAAALPVEKPMSTTGFAWPAAAIIQGLLDKGMWVDHLVRGAGLREIPKGLGFDVYVPPDSDPNANQYIGYLMQALPQKPDCLVFEADPTSIMIWRHNVIARVGQPSVCHLALEGAPLMRPLSEAMKEIVIQDKKQRIVPGNLSAYTQFGADTVTRATGAPCEAIGLGTDHADFRKYSIEERDEIREALGWSDKYVVMNVARNAGRKNWPVLLRAIQALVPKYPNLILYAHCVAFENFNLNGHDLRALAMEMGIGDHVLFDNRMLSGSHGISYERSETNPVGLIDYYNAADVFVSPSGAEGWNLPQCEAAACGLPVITTAYGGGWEVAQGFAIPLEPIDYAVHQSGAYYALHRVQDVADAIEGAMHDKDLKQRTDRGMDITHKMTWETLGNRMAEIVTETLR